MIDTKLLCLISGTAAGVVRTLKGWLDSKDPFDARLFCYTLLRTMIQGAAAGYWLNQDPILAFFEVLSVDWLIINRAMDKIGNKIAGGNK